VIHNIWLWFIVLPLISVGTLNISWFRFILGKFVIEIPRVLVRVIFVMHRLYALYHVFTGIKLKYLC